MDSARPECIEKLKPPKEIYSLVVSSFDRKSANEFPAFNASTKPAPGRAPALTPLGGSMKAISPIDVTLEDFCVEPNDIPYTPEEHGYIYVIRTLDYYKIGKASDPQERRKQLASGCPFEMTLIHQFRCTHVGVIERKLHRDFRREKVRGEWFRLKENQVRWLESIIRCDGLKFITNKGN